MCLENSVTKVTLFLKSVSRGWVGIKFPEKKACYITIEMSPSAKPKPTPQSNYFGYDSRNLFI